MQNAGNVSKFDLDIAGQWNTCSSLMTINMSKGAINNPLFVILHFSFKFASSLFSKQSVECGCLFMVPLRKKTRF